MIRKYKNVITGAALLLGAVLAYKLYKGMKAGKSAINSIIDDVTSSTTVNQLNDALLKNNIPSANAARIMRVSEDIYRALHKDSAFGWFEDEEKAVEAFNSLVSIQEARAVSSLYSSSFQKSLYNDLKNYIHGSTWNQLKPVLISAIKP